MAQWEKKVWGSVCHLFANERAAISHLKLKRGFRCSRHRHADRVNAFFVIRGRVAIEVEDDLRRRQILYPGEVCVVPTGLLHWFRVLEDGEMIEHYWADEGKTVRLDDIERLDEGGPDEPLPAFSQPVCREGVNLLEL